jgi:putative ABC transport system permease protein
MRLLAILKIAFRALRRNTLRTLLTMLGIIIGVGAVIAMVSIGNGAKSMVEAQIASLGQNVILVFSGSTTRGGMNTGWGSAGTLTTEDAKAIRTEIPEVVGLSPQVRTFSQVLAGNQNWSTQVSGESEEVLDIRQWPLAAGSMFTDADVRNANKVAVIGQTIAKQLFPDADPVGQLLRIKNVPFTVVGVLSAKGLSVMGSDQDDVVMVPYTCVMRRLSGQTTLRSMMVEAPTLKALPELQTQITELLRQRHKIGPGRDDDFTVRTQQEIAETATATSRTMTLLLGAIASVSLVVGGIGIMNIMLVSVTERTREIGIRMAVGARGRDILLQFLTEAVSLSILGGLIGIALGVAAGKGLAANQNWPVLISTSSVVLAFVFSAAVGVFFGFYPARKAAKLDPIDALRYE